MPTFRDKLKLGMEQAISKRRWLKWSLIAAGWTLFGVFFASESVVSRAYLGRPLNPGDAITVWLICAYIWLSATPLVLYLAHRFPLERQVWVKNFLVHLGISCVLAIFLLGIYVVIASWAGLIVNEPITQALRNQIVASFHAEILTYWAVIGLSHALDYYLKYREREVRASQLEAQLARAQLDALKTQLHPHFLFNTLNTISVLMQEDVRLANHLLLRLSDLLRLALKNTEAHEVPLREELDFLSTYLEIEQTRFQDRLTVRIEIEPGALEARVPNLILQPLVENAIRHGIAPRARPGLIEIHAAREHGLVRLQVRDNGPGLGSASPESLIKGIGLSNTQARLKQLYGSAHNFEIRDARGGGLEVVISIPFRNGVASSANSTG